MGEQRRGLMTRSSALCAISLLVLGASRCGGKTFSPDGPVAGTNGAGTGGGGGTGTGGATGGNATGGSSGKAAGGDAGAAAEGGATSTGGGPAGGRAGAGSSGDAGAASGAGGASGAGTGGDAGASAAGSGGAVAGAGGIGTSGAAGVAGAGGVPSGAECVTADDCVRVTDCCSCTAEPKNTGRPMCDLACTEDACFALGITPEEVTCAYGRCVFDRSCDGSESTCTALPPSCTGGTIPSVKDGCWGPCLPPTECRTVPSCDACTAAGAACVRNELQVLSIGCVDPGDCEKGNLCECLDACLLGCAEQETGVGCYCAGC